MKRSRYLLFIIIFALLGCQKSTQVHFREYSKIVFLSNRDAPKGQFDIFIMNLDGSEQINLTEESESIRSISRPVLSPDQKSILFVAFEENRTALKLLDLARSSVLDLTEVGFEVPQASFSPNGDKILFVKKIAGRRQIHIMNTDGSGEQNLSNNNYDEFDPTFSPEGSKIAFVNNRNGIKSIWIMNSDGSNPKLATDQKGNDGHPSFSPDGKSLVFHSFRNGSNNIYLAHPKKNSVKALYESKANNIEPQFLPDGIKILFLSNERGMKYQDVYTYDFKEKITKVVSNHINFINQNPQFSPDGKKIVFESVKFNDAEIYIVDADGQNLINLTNHPKWDCLPSF